MMTLSDKYVENHFSLFQYGGGVLRERLGRLFIIAWTLLISSFFRKLEIMPL